MSINYRVVGRANPLNREAGQKYYASLNAKGRRTMRYIAKQIAERSSLNQMDVLSTIEGFLQIIPETLIDGYIVDLGDFGNMWLQAKAGSAEAAEDYHSSLIEGLKVNFRPGKLFKAELNDAEFVKLSE